MPGPLYPDTERLITDLRAQLAVAVAALQVATAPPPAGSPLPGPRWQGTAH